MDYIDFIINGKDFWTVYEDICSQITPEDVDAFFEILDPDLTDSYIQDAYKFVDSKEELLYAAYYIFLFEWYKCNVVDVMENEDYDGKPISWFTYTFSYQ